MHTLGHFLKTSAVLKMIVLAVMIETALGQTKPDDGLPWFDPRFTRLSTGLPTSIIELTDDKIATMKGNVLRVSSDRGRSWSETAPIQRPPGSIVPRGGKLLYIAPLLRHPMES